MSRDGGRDADVVVVGGGITGAAAARALARAGRAVVLFEQFPLGHARGSSHGASRIFRLAYPDPYFVRLAQRALVEWRRLEAELGERLIVPTGSLDVGDVATDIAAALSACRASSELLDGDAVSRRWPIALDRDARALFQADGGVLLAERAHSALLAQAREAGAMIIEDTPVTGLHDAGGSVVVETGGSEVKAATAVVAAGAWLSGLLEQLGIELRVVPTRETVAYFSLHEAEQVPPLIDYAASPPPGVGFGRSGQASYAVAAPGIGLKAGLHHAGPPTDPDADGAADERVIAWTAAWVARRFPETDGQPVAGETCLYTNTPDARFVLERRGRVVVASACSGHGFKFAPVVAQTIVALALDSAG